MSATVVRLQRVFQHSCDWLPRELAEFYRVEAALIQAGLKIDTDRGVSDEGDPWFAFCRPDSGEVVVHIARLGGVYHLAGPAYMGVATGHDIAALVRDLVARHPLIQTQGNKSGHQSRIFLHPAALLIAVVATAFFKSTEARALSDEHKPSGDSRSAGAAVAIRSESSLVETHKTIVMDAAQAAVILNAVAAVLQIPSPSASENETSETAVSSVNSSNATPSLPPSSHWLDAGLTPAAAEMQHFGVVPDSHAAPFTGISFNAPVHVGIADAMPLVAVLWDAPVSRFEATTSAPSNAPAVPTEASPGSVMMHAPLITFKMGPAAGSEEIPAIQTAKITSSDSHGIVDSQVIAKPEQLPAALVSALKDAAHASIDLQPGNGSGGSFAGALFLWSTDSQRLPKDTGATLSPAQDTSSQAHDTSTTQPAKTLGPAAADSATKTLPPNAQDVSALVQEFFSHTLNWKMVNDGSAVVVYDMDALNAHPNELKSVSFDFTDGSTLSLVGLPAELPHLAV